MISSREVMLVRFWAKVEKTETCWLWTGALSEGYGCTWDGERKQFAHRVAYELFVGPIPAGLQIDHVYAWGCRHRNCVNPAHLEPVTNAVNASRGARARNTHCPHGHSYSDAYRGNDGSRQCRTCHLKRTNARHHARKAATA